MAEPRRGGPITPVLIAAAVFVLGFVVRGMIPPGALSFLDGEQGTLAPEGTPSGGAGADVGVSGADGGVAPTPAPERAYVAPSVPGYLLQSPGARVDVDPTMDFGLGPNHVSRLEPVPDVKPGDITTLELWRYGGRGRTSWGTPRLPVSFEAWSEKLTAQRPKLMAEVKAAMERRYEFSGRAIAGATMTRGKPIMAGPVARLPQGLTTWEALALLPPDEIRAKNLFPYKPLAHPLQSTGHMLFPDRWVELHPEHGRIDVGFDIPEAYLPESPPPLFLSTHKELGDVSGGQEITLGNYFELFDGLLTPEQMEGLKELLRPTPTTWFNQTGHRVTAAPSAGVSCLGCHTNGHTNAAIALGPDSRPNLLRLRVDTPTLRGAYNALTLSSKRSIRGLDHFSEVEEYFDGDPAMAQAIGARAVKDEVSARMGDFQAIIDLPPAPKLGPDMRLVRGLASDAELRGEALFSGKARCSTCHMGPAFTDHMLHDLQVERFYVGRPEGPIKTFSLRGIKDSPPYLHDGRLPTLHDTVEFFNLVLGLGLSATEKADLVAYLLCL